jgi:predicted  nucleic acid-binding Zn-ribbon protein
MKKFLVALSLIFALVSCTSSEIEEMNLKITTLENRISEAEKTSLELRETLAILKNETKNLEENISSLNEKAEDMKKSLGE